MTFAAAVTRFTPLITVGITVEEAIQEAIDRIYEMGRWPGTTIELEFAEEDFVEEDDKWFLFMDDEAYAGMIGFRDDSRGWTIQDHTALYKDGVNAGDLSLIDMGEVTVSNVIKRKYRMPLGFVPSAGPYFALMKLESPELTDEDIIPIQSVGALKAAIRAVCYEYVSDDDRALLYWQKFEQEMSLSQRQSNGPKKFNLGMDSSLRRKPSQFP